MKKALKNKVKTKIIGVKDFRQNLAAYYAKGIKNGLQYIVTSRNQAIFEVKPLSKKEAAMRKLAAELAAAEEDVKAGRVHSLENVMKRFGVTA